MEKKEVGGQWETIFFYYFERAFQEPHVAAEERMLGEAFQVL
jgi:hypothetical protein